jgi:hypothetical protein
MVPPKRECSKSRSLQTFFAVSKVSLGRKKVKKIISAKVVYSAVQRVRGNERYFWRRRHHGVVPARSSLRRGACGQLWEPNSVRGGGVKNRSLLSSPEPFGLLWSLTCHCRPGALGFHYVLRKTHLQPKSVCFPAGRRGGPNCHPTKDGRGAGAASPLQITSMIQPVS